MISVYIHIPFCQNICSYCDFCKIFYNEKMVDEYLEALKLEIETNYKGEVVKTIYIGGGTPSVLNINQLTKLLEITKIFKMATDFEFTIEGNFESTDFSKLDLYKKYGVNRLSFGIETTNESLLKLLKRTLDKSHVVEIINYAKKLGLYNINVDLIYALPGEDILDLKNDLEFIYSLGIKHISTYSLIIENNTILGIKGFKSIDEDLDSEMYNFIRKYLKDRGFEHYEISNFCLKGYESKHNLVYWNNFEYYGFGAGASSYIGNKRINNTRSVTKYCTELFARDYEELDFHDKMEYEIILNLRTSKGILKDKFKKLYGKDVDEYYNYDKLVKDGFLFENNERIYINEDYWYISNRIIIEFLEGEING